MGYAHIDNLYKNQDILMFRECYAMEKIHGTSAHISFKIKEQLLEGNCKTCLTFFSGGEKHENFIKLFNKEFLLKKFTELNLPDLTIYGEAYGGKCQGMSETYGKELKFVAFDVKIGDNWIVVPEAEELVKQFNLDFVHWRKIFTDLEEIDKIRDMDSIQAVKNGIGYGKKREGIVLRPLVEVRKNNGERICAKHKREDFQETKTPRRVVNLEQLKIWKEIKETAEEWCTEMRLMHVLDKIEDKGNFKVVITAMLEDIQREGNKEIVWSKDLEKQIAQLTGKMLKNYLNKNLKKGDK